MPSTSARRLATIGLLALVGCGGAESPPAGEEDSPTLARTVSVAAPDTAAPAYGIRFEVNRKTFSPGDTVRMHMLVYNEGQAPLTLQFPTAQRYDFVFRRAGEGLGGRVAWRWSADRFFAQATGRERLGAGEALEARAVRPAPGEPGIYRVEASVPASEWPISATVPITVTP